MYIESLNKLDQKNSGYVFCDSFTEWLNSVAIKCKNNMLTELDIAEIINVLDAHYTFKIPITSIIQFWDTGNISLSNNINTSTTTSEDNLINIQTPIHSNKINSSLDDKEG